MSTATANLTDNIVQAGRVAAALVMGGQEAQKAMRSGVADVRRHVRAYLEDHAYARSQMLHPPVGYTQAEWGRLNLDGFLEAAAKATDILFPSDEG